MRRVIAAIAAILLAIVGAVLVSNYVRQADARAMAGLDATEVLVVSAAVPEGTPADALTEFVAVETLPAAAVAEGAIADLGEVAGQVTTTSLVPGEQILEARFADPADLAEPTRIDPPTGFQEVTIQLEAQRVLGGTLKAGDLVGMIFSATLENQEEGQSADVTSNVLDQVLVTRVALTEATTNEDGERAPQSLYVTFAVNTPQAETIVFGMEHASIWLTIQPEGDLAGTSEVITGEVLIR